MAKLVSQNTDMLLLSPGDKHFLFLNGLEQAKWNSGSECICVMLLPVSVIVSRVCFIFLFLQETSVWTPARKLGDFTLK